MPDKVTDAMESDIKRMASNLRPQVSAVSSAPMPDARDRVTVSHIHAALDQLTQAAREQADTAWALLGQLTGANESQPVEDPAKGPVGPVFEAMARQITDAGRQLARLKRAHEAIGKSLS